MFTTPESVFTIPEWMFTIPESAFMISESVFTIGRNQCSRWSGIRTLGTNRGETRVLLAGDSFVFGNFVENEETVPAQLERKMRPLCPRLTVINAELRGGTIVGQRELILRGLVLAPDLVLLGFYENDVADMAHPLWPQLSQSRRNKSRFPLSILYPVLRHTATRNLIIKARGGLRARRNAAVVTRPDGQPANTRELALMARYEAELLAFA